MCAQQEQAVLVSWWQRAKVAAASAITQLLEEEAWDDESVALQRSGSIDALTDEPTSSRRDQSAENRMNRFRSKSANAFGLDKPLDAIGNSISESEQAKRTPKLPRRSAQSLDLPPDWSTKRENSSKRAEKSLPPSNDSGPLSDNVGATVKKSKYGRVRPFRPPRSRSASQGQVTQTKSTDRRLRAGTMDAVLTPAASKSKGTASAQNTLASLDSRVPSDHLPAAMTNGLQAGWIREAVGAGMPPPSGSAPMKSAEAHSTGRVWRKEYVFGCAPDAMVPGILSFSDTVITFEPDKRSLPVKSGGVGAYQMILPTSDISEAAAIVLPRTRGVEDLFSLPNKLSKKWEPVWIAEKEKNSRSSGMDSSQASSPPSKTHGEESTRDYIAAQQNASSIGLLQLLLKRHAHTTKRPLHIPLLPDAINFSTTHIESSTEVSGSTTTRARRIAAAKLGVIEEVQQQEKMEKDSLSQQHDASAGKRESSAETHTGSTQDKKHAHVVYKPKSFIMFRLSSSSVVKDVARQILDILDRQEHLIESHPFAFIPFVSNAVLDRVIQLCVEVGDEDEDDDDGSNIIGDGDRGGESPLRASSGEDRRSIKHAMTTDDNFLSAQQKRKSMTPWHLRQIIPTMEVLPGATSLLLESMSADLSAALPPTVALRKWIMLFDTSLHGVSLLSFFMKTEGSAPALLLVRDNHGVVFGGFSPDGFKEHRHYYGTGETIVFTFGKTPTLQVFPWSGRNSYYIYSDHSRIVFGGGGQYAFALDHDLLQGTAGYCPTYNNTCLLAGSEDFSVSRIQVWGFERLAF